MGPGRALSPLWDWDLARLNACPSRWRVRSVCKLRLAALAVSRLSLAMPTLENRGQQIRQGLRRAVQGGQVLGGLRPARDQLNQRIHLQALQQALKYRKVLIAGREKSLSELSRDLCAAGCTTSKGKPLTPEMVRRLRVRLNEALLAFASGELEDESAEWDPFYEIQVAIQQRNKLMLRWHLRMVRKELGDTIAVHVEQILMGSEHASWVRDALGQA